MKLRACNIAKIFRLSSLLLVSMSVFFFGMHSAHAANLYFIFIDDGDWSNSNNWFLDIGAETPANRIPNSSDDVFIESALSNIPNGATVHNADFESGSGLGAGLTLTVTGTSTFEGDVGDNNDGTINGNALFIRAGNNGDVNGFAQFDGQDGSPASNYGWIYGNAVFNDTGSNNGNISNNAYFYGVTENYGDIYGNAYFYGDTTQNLFFISGSRYRVYQSNSTTFQDFITYGAFTVIADGVEVDVSGAAFNSYSTFQAINGGSFIGGPRNAYFWTSGADRNWSTAGNWYSDSGHTTLLGGIPTSHDNVIAVGTIGPIISTDSWTPPLSIDVTSTSLGVTSNTSTEISYPLEVGLDLDVHGNASINSSDILVHGESNFYDTSACNNATLLSTATFHDSSTISSSNCNPNGNAVVFLGESTELTTDNSNLAIVKRVYTSDITTTRNFTLHASWEVVADGAVVDVSGGFYDDTTTFTKLNGGYFVGGPDGSGQDLVDPSVTDSAASSLSQTGAVLNGSITAEGSPQPDTRGFEYGTSDSYGTIVSESGSFSTGDFATTLSSLTCNTTYYFRAFATNSSGTASSTGRSFTTSACSTGGGGGGGVSSGGGGYISPSVLAKLLATPPGCPTGYTCVPKMVVGCPVGYTCTPAVNNQQGNNAPVPGTPTTFTRNIDLGYSGADVKTLQQYLNAKGFFISPNGQPGSPGRETTIFGYATKAALIKFQIANGLPGTGFFGPLTRAFVASH